MRKCLLTHSLLVLDILEVVGPCSPFLHAFSCPCFFLTCSLLTFSSAFSSSSTAHPSLLTFLPHSSCRFHLIFHCLSASSRLILFSSQAICFFHACLSSMTLCCFFKHRHHSQISKSNIPRVPAKMICS